MRSSTSSFHFDRNWIHDSLDDDDDICPLFLASKIFNILAAFFSGSLSCDFPFLLSFSGSAANTITWIKRNNYVV